MEGYPRNTCPRCAAARDGHEYADHALFVDDEISRCMPVYPRLIFGTLRGAGAGIFFSYTSPSPWRTSYNVQLVPSIPQMVHWESPDGTRCTRRHLPPQACSRDNHTQVSRNDTDRRHRRHRRNRTLAGSDLCRSIQSTAAPPPCVPIGFRLAQTTGERWKAKGKLGGWASADGEGRRKVSFMRDEGSSFRSYFSPQH